MKPKIIFLVLITFLLVTCKKKGCSYPKAINYDSNATIDDGSCKYEPTKSSDKTVFVTFFQDSTQAHQYINNISTTLYLFINNTMVDNFTATYYSTNNLICNNTSYLNYTFNAILTNSITFDWKILNQNSITLYSGHEIINLQNINGDMCWTKNFHN